mgnify:CR=1 FL=1
MSRENPVRREDGEQSGLHETIEQVPGFCNSCTLTGGYCGGCSGEHWDIKKVKAPDERIFFTTRNSDELKKNGYEIVWATSYAGLEK